MALKSQFLELSKMLSPYIHLWNREILNYYPDSLDHYSPEWLERLEKLTKDQLWRFDSFNDLSQVKGSPLEKFLHGIIALVTPVKEIHPTLSDLPDWAYFKMKSKKRHEITCLLPAINKLYQLQQFDHGVDIGGGQGHLSKILAHYLSIPMFCIDKDLELQNIGRKRLNKYPTPMTARDVTFINREFGKDNLSFKKNALSLGLHTCGALANTHIKTATQSDTKVLLNFGCCYLKLDPLTDLNLSKSAKINPLHLSTHALTMASRAHGGISREDFNKKERVKFYRYALHLFLYEELGINKFIGVGNSPDTLYQGTFHDYALFNLKRLKIAFKHGKTDLDHFFNDQKRQEQIKKMFLANIIRWKFGRPLEYYILLDRALYLEENNYTVKVSTYFDEGISPRNIGIMAIKN